MSDKNENPIDTIRIVLDRLRKETDDIGLSVNQVAIIPAIDGGPDILQVIYIIQPKAVTPDKTPEQLADEQAVENMFRATHEQEINERAASIKDDVADWLNDI